MTFDDGSHPGVAAAISMRPILERLDEAFDDIEAPAGLAETVVQALAESYLAGARDGARDVVGQIAPEAAARGLNLRLAPDLAAGEAGDGG